MKKKYQNKSSFLRTMRVRRASHIRQHISHTRSKPRNPLDPMPAKRNVDNNVQMCITSQEPKKAL